jgi:hypothetical protein
MGQMRNEYIFIGKPDGKRQVGRAGQRANNIKINFKEIGFKDVDWIM